MDKPEMLARVLQARDRGLTMVFSRTKRTAQKVADDLTERGFAAAAVHGDLGQGAREKALRAFRAGKVDVLVATDVAARGIDIDDVTHVINYQCPEDEKTYVHRIGRTGRAGRTGVAVTFVDWDETNRWQVVNDLLGLGQPLPVETYSTSDHLFADLGIPSGSTGRLPLSHRTRAGLAAEEEENLDTGKRKRRRRTGSTRGAESAPEANEETRPKRTRTRTRSRAGVAEEGQQAETSSPDAAEKSASDKPRRRRRRRTSAEQAAPSAD
jgi:superfamily II DNA/RNA helicase